MERALITGVTGFVGGHLAEHLLAQGDAVFGCAEVSKWPEATPHDLARRAEILDWDLADPSHPTEEVLRRIEDFGPTVIYHLAAVSSPGACGGNQPNALARAVNVDGTRRVMQAAARLSSRPRVLLVSTSHVYDPSHYRGSAAPPRPGASEPSGVIRLSEDAPIGPRRGYGQSKWLAEGEVRAAVQRHGVDAVIVRAFQHTGPRQTARMMLPEWIWQLQKREAPRITLHTLDAWIDLTDVRDVVRAYRLVAAKAESGAVLNVGSSVCRRTGDLFRLLQTLADDARPVVERSPGFKMDPIADTRRLQQATGWRPRIPLEETLADAWAYWQARIAERR